MAALIEAALDLGAVGFVLLCIAFLIAVRAILVPLIDVLNVEIAGVHIWGGVLTKARNAVIRGCNSGIAEGQQLVGDLLHGLAWAIRWQVNAVLRFVHAVESSLDLLWRHAIKGIAASVVAAEQKARLALAAQVNKLTATVLTDVKTLKTLIASTATSTLTKARAFATSEANRTAAAVRNELHADVATLNRSIADLHALLDADVQSIIGTLNQQLVAVRGYADAAAAAGLRTAEAELAGLASTLEGDILTAEQLVEGELGSAVKTIDDLIASTVAGIEAQINGLAIPSIADLSATVAALAATVALVLAESGLDNASCRQKVKGICGTDITKWLSLLAGLAAVEGGLNLGTLISAGSDIARVSGNGLKEFVQAA